MKTVVFSFLGTTLDRRGPGQKRWERWRPTVGLCMQDDVQVDRLEMLYAPSAERLATTITDDIGTVSPETEVRPHHIAFSDPWDFEEVYDKLHAFLRDYPFDLEAERYFAHITTGTHVCQICLFLLCEAHHLPGQLLQTGPGRSREEDVRGQYAVIDLDLSRYDRIAARFSAERLDDVSFLKSGIDTKNRAFNRLIEQIERVAMRSQEPLLFTGPTGAGKSHLVRRVYELKKNRRQVTGPFVEVNCATLRGDAMMSTLFGHEKGAFTGAVSARKGLLRAAHNGVVLLDEVGELGLDEQAMLLQAIEEKRFLPVGADQEEESDFQLMCGTNRDLHQAVTEGHFREDLLARIQCWSFHLPGLRDRPEDIAPNLDYELEQYAQRSGERIRFSAQARQHFLRFARSGEALWRANFRDLNGAVLRMATLAEGGRIGLEDVQEEIDRLRAAWRRGDQPGNILRPLLSPEKLAEIDPFDQVQLAEVARVCKSSPTMSEAGRRLFAASRLRRRSANDADRLRKYLGRFDLAWRDIQE